MVAPRGEGIESDFIKKGRGWARMGVSGPKRRFEREPALIFNAEGAEGAEERREGPKNNGDRSAKGKELSLIL